MYIFGASGQGKVIASILEANETAGIEGFLDDNPTRDTLFGLPVHHANVISDYQKTEIIIAVGNNATRKKIAERLQSNYFNAIHPSSAVCSTVIIGEGTAVMPQAVVNADAVIGSHCIINSGAVVEHDCILDDYVHISPNAALAGNVSVGEGTHVGMGALVIPQMQIGKWVTIGAGAVIIDNVPDYAVVVGNPGRIVKYNEPS